MNPQLISICKHLLKLKDNNFQKAAKKIKQREKLTRLLIWFWNGEKFNKAMKPKKQCL